MKLSPMFVILAASAVVAGAAPVTKAVANLSPTQGNTVAGKVTFAKVEGGVKVSVHVTGLKEGAHAFHIHEFGDCSAPDGLSAGGHFNPSDQPHPAPTAPPRHTRDL